MDGIMIIIIALGMTIYGMSPAAKKVVPTGSDQDIKAEQTTRETKLNDSFYEDEKAFSLIINMLGYPKQK